MHNIKWAVAALALVVITLPAEVAGDWAKES
jgi:hypothetical protein